MVQYWHFLSNTARGNLGVSYYNGGEPVKTITVQDLPITASVVIGGLVLWLTAGLSAGILSATRPRSLFDRTSTVSVLAGLSLPTFVLGELLIIAVFVPLNQHGFSWIQTGYAGLSHGTIPWAGHMILPWITIATVQAAVYTRLSRGSLIDTLGEDYIRTARAKGLSERRVTYRHALRAALTPVASQLGIDVGALLGGVIVVEQVFGPRRPRPRLRPGHRHRQPARHHRLRPARLHLRRDRQHHRGRLLRDPRPAGPHHLTAPT